MSGDAEGPAPKDTGPDSARRRAEARLDASLESARRHIDASGTAEGASGAPSEPEADPSVALPEAPEAAGPDARELSTRLRRIRDRLLEIHSRAEEQRRLDAELEGHARDLTASAREAAAAVIGVQAALRQLIDAQEEESEARAVQGPGLKARVVLTEARRQQEALLDALVGRRAELEDIAAEIRSLLP